MMQRRYFKTDRTYKTMVVRSARGTGKSKIPYAVALSPGDWFLPVVARIKTRGVLSHPWAALQEELIALGRMNWSFEKVNGTGTALHILLFSVYIEWILFTWEFARGALDNEAQVPLFVVRILETEESEKAIAARFRALAGSVVDAADFGVCYGAVDRWRSLVEQLSTTIRASFEKRTRLIFFVDDISCWGEVTCFREVGTKQATSNMYGLVSAAEDASGTIEHMVLMGTTWDFNTHSYSTSFRFHSGPEVTDELPLMKTEEMCALLDHYFDFGADGVARRYPRLTHALRLLHGRPAFFVNGFLGALARNPEWASDEARLVQLVDDVFAHEARKLMERMSACVRYTGTRPHKLVRAELVREMVRAMSVHGGKFDSRNTDEFGASECASLGFFVREKRHTFGDISVSIENELILKHALRLLVCARFSDPNRDPLFSHSMSDQHRERLPRLLAWHIIKPRTVVPSFDDLFHTVGQAWSRGYLVHANEVFVFSERSRSDSHVLAQSALHALFDWTEKGRPQPILSRVVLTTSSWRTEPELLFFVARALAPDCPLQDFEYECDGKAVRLVAVAIGDKLTARIRALDTHSMHRDDGHPERRKSAVAVLCTKGLGPIFRCPIRLFAAVAPQSTLVAEKLSEWNSAHAATPVAVFEMTERDFGVKGQRCIAAKARERSYAWERAPDESSLHERLALAFDLAALKREGKEEK